MKKKISVFIAVIMFLNLLVFPDLFRRSVLAAAIKYNLSAEYEQKLIEGRTNSIPLREDKHLTGGNAFIKWNIQTPTGGSLDNGKFMLQYPLATGGIAQFALIKNLTKATITYNIFDPDDYNLLSDNVSKIYYTPVDTPESTYSVHTQHGAVLGQANYVPYNQFINDGFASDYYVETTNPTPTFHINKGEGFSFKFGNQTMHFLWSPASGDFYYSTDAFEQSKIFPVSLFLATNVTTSNYDTPSKLNILTGIKSGSGIDPANDNITSEAISNNRDVNDILQHTSADNPRQNPAEDDNIMKIRIKIPEVWDDTNGVFKVGETGETPLGFTLDLVNNTQNQIQVRIDNIFQPMNGATSLSSVSGTTFYPSAAVNNGRPARVNANNAADNNGDYILFTLGEMPYGQIFEGTAGFMQKEGYSFNYTKIPFGKFYTFMKYSISFIGDKYYAIVEPYKGYSGYYRLLVGGNKTVTSYSTGLSPIYMPLALQENSGNIATYQMLFNPEVTFESSTENVVYSQIMKYEAGPESMSISIPNNFEILEHRYIPTDELSTDADKEFKGTLKLDLRWEIGREKTIMALVDNSPGNKITLKYKIYSTIQPYAINPDGTPDTNKNYVLATIVLDIELVAGRYKVTYSEEKANSTDKDKLVFDTVAAERYFTGADSNVNDSVVQIPTRDVIYRAYVTLDTLAYNKNAITNPITPPKDIDFYFPNIYFLNIQPFEVITYKNDGTADVVNNLENTIGASLYDSMTLDDYTRPSPPTPQNLEAFDAITTNVAGIATEVSMKLKWLVPNEKINEYFLQSYPYDYNDIAFNLYVSQSESNLKPLTAIPGILDRLDSPGVIKFPYKEIYVPDEKSMYFSDINGNTAYVVNSKTARDYLREGKVVCITDIPPDLTIEDIDLALNGAPFNAGFKMDGLDKNQKYYFSMDMTAGFFTKKLTAGDPPDFPDDYELKKITNSMMTSIVTETTKGDESKPGPEDKFPPAPVLSKDDVSLSSADILWNKITEPNAQASNVKLEYEIIRVKAKPLDSALLNSRIDFVTFFQNSVKNEDKIGLQTDGGKLKEFNGASFVYSTSGKYKYDALTNTIRLTDGSLSPNQLYFYYVRTVRTVSDKILYSVWSDISVTTTPVKPPVNLVVERAEAVISYNKEKQFVISFDVPLTDISTLGKDFELQYSIKKDNGDWSPALTMNVSELTSAGRYSDSAKEGYIHFKYVVSRMYDGRSWAELASGSSYSIRVRIVDLKNGDQSVYSNIAEARTELNQEEYDKGKITDEWLQYLRDELSKIIKEYYWYARKTNSETIVIYRPDMFDELLTHSEGSQLQLVKSDSFRTVYYLPASSVLKANEENKGFKFLSSDIEFLLSPNALDTDYNEAFIKIGDKIKDKAVKDYYVKITVTRQISTKFVDGYQPLSHQTNVTIETVGNMKDNKIFDGEIFNMLLDEVEKQATSRWNADKIKEMLEDKESNENIVKYIAELVQDAKDAFADKVERALEKTLKSYFPVVDLVMPLILRYSNAEQGIVVRGYQAANEIWVSKDIISMDGIHSMNVNATGTFIFAGNKIYLPRIEGLKGSEDITNLIIKYSLDDYLGKAAAFKIDSNVTGFMAAGVAARLMGASKTADPIVFLNGKGYIISTRTSSSPISKQEAIYLLMAVYETKTNTKIASVKINNYTLTSNVKNISDKYSQTTKVAYQLGIVSDKNMDAKSNITVAEFLDMLLKLKDKAKL